MRVFKKFNNNIYPACTLNIRLKQAFFIRITSSWLYKSICSHVSIDQGEIIIKHFRHFHPLHALNSTRFHAFFWQRGDSEWLCKSTKLQSRDTRLLQTFLEKPLKPKLEERVSSNYSRDAGVSSHLWLCAAVVLICQRQERDVSSLLGLMQILSSCNFGKMNKSKLSDHISRKKKHQECSFTPVFGNLKCEETQRSRAESYCKHFLIPFSTNMWE